MPDEVHAGGPEFAYVHGVDDGGDAAPDVELARLGCAGRVLGGYDSADLVLYLPAYGGWPAY